MNCTGRSIYCLFKLLRLSASAFMLSADVCGDGGGSAGFYELPGYLSVGRGVLWLLTSVCWSMYANK